MRLHKHTLTLGCLFHVPPRVRVIASKHFCHSCSLQYVSWVPLGFFPVWIPGQGLTSDVYRLIHRDEGSWACTGTLAQCKLMAGSFQHQNVLLECFPACTFYFCAIPLFDLCVTLILFGLDSLPYTIAGSAKCFQALKENNSSLCVSVCLHPWVCIPSPSSHYPFPSMFCLFCGVFFHTPDFFKRISDFYPVK